MWAQQPLILICFVSDLISLIFLCVDINQEQLKVTARLASPPILDPVLSSWSCQLVKRYRPQETILYMEPSGEAPWEAPCKRASVFKKIPSRWLDEPSVYHGLTSANQINSRRAHTAEPGERRVKTCFTSWDVLCSFLMKCTLQSW